MLLAFPTRRRERPELAMVVDQRFVSSFETVQGGDTSPGAVDFDGRREMARSTCSPNSFPSASTSTAH
jgi:hypothetical protein